MKALKKTQTTDFNGNNHPLASSFFDRYRTPEGKVVGPFRRLCVSALPHGYRIDDLTVVLNEWLCCENENNKQINKTSKITDDIGY